MRAVVVTIFSDPMVDTITAFANNIAISPFYVSFLITPVVCALPLSLSRPAFVFM